MVNKGQRVVLYGWINNFRRGKRVRIYSKSGNQYKFKFLRKKTTRKGGKWRVVVPIQKNIQFKVKWGRKVSRAKLIRVIK